MAGKTEFYEYSRECLYGMSAMLNAWEAFVPEDIMKKGEKADSFKLPDLLWDGKMDNGNEHISEKAESTENSARIRIPLYEHRKGKEFRASGSWQATKWERRIIETFGGMFFFGILIGLILSFIHPGKLSFILLGIGIAGAVGSFISLFAIVLRKHKQEPMEAHYYEVDYRSNAFTGEETDHTREITKEEFLGKKEESLK